MPIDAVADVLVPVLARAEFGLGVVGVDGGELVGAELALELVNRLLETGDRGEVVSGGVGVAGVEADADAWVVDGVHDGGEFGEG